MVKIDDESECRSREPSFRGANDAREIIPNEVGLARGLDMLVTLGRCSLLAGRTKSVEIPHRIEIGVWPSVPRKPQTVESVSEDRSSFATRLDYYPGSIWHRIDYS